MSILSNVVMITGAWCEGCNLMRKKLNGNLMQVKKIHDIESQEGGKVACGYNITSLPTFINVVTREQHDGLATIGQLVQLNIR